MTRRNKLAASLIGAIAATGAAAAVVVVLVTRVPVFYGRVESMSAAERVAASKQFVRRSADIWNEMENERLWTGRFHESQVNSWLACDFAQKHASVLPSGVSQPRISFVRGRLALAFRRQIGPVRCIISVSGRVWLPEPNLVAVEFDEVRAGVLPLPAAHAVSALAAAARSAGIGIEWKQLDGNPVALLQLGDPATRHNIELKQIEIEDGVLFVAGSSRTHEATGRPQAQPAAPPAGGISRNDQSPESPPRR